MNPIQNPGAIFLATILPFSIMLRRRARGNRLTRCQTKSQAYSPALAESKRLTCDVAFCSDFSGFRYRSADRTHGIRLRFPGPTSSDRRRTGPSTASARGFADAARRVDRDPLEHVLEAGARVRALQQAGRDRALDDPDRLRADLLPAEERVLPAERQNRQAALQMIMPISALSSTCPQPFMSTWPRKPLIEGAPPFDLSA